MGKYHCICLLVFAFLLLQSCQSDKKYFEVSVLDYGAKNDGLTLCSEAFQKALDEASALGGGTVLVPAGRYVCGTILLKDNTTLHLEEGAEIQGSYYMKDYYNIDPFVDAVKQQRGNCLIGAKGAKNVAITGKGVINGRGERMRYKKGERSKRPFLIRIVNSSNVEISGIRVRNSAAWSIHLFQSKQVRIKGVRILSQSGGNGDGIDIDSSEDVLISGCDINTHDDAICFKSTSPVPCKNCRVTDCLLSSRWGAIKFGTESMGNFENIEVDHCYVYDTRGGGMKILSVDGAHIRNLHIHDIEMNHVEMPIFIRLGARLNTYRNAEKQAIGSMDSITIRNIKIHGKRDRQWLVNPPSTIFITGIEDARIKNVLIENIDAKMHFEGTAAHADKQVPEKRTDYPEFIRFEGHVPAYGAYIRHAEGITLKNIHIQTTRSEQRHIVKTEDVENFLLDGLEIEMDAGASAPFSFFNTRNARLSGIHLTGNIPDELIKRDQKSEGIHYEE